MSGIVYGSSSTRYRCTHQKDNLRAHTLVYLCRGRSIHPASGVYVPLLLGRYARPSRRALESPLRPPLAAPSSTILMSLEGGRGFLNQLALLRLGAGVPRPQVWTDRRVWIGSPEESAVWFCGAPVRSGAFSFEARSTCVFSIHLNIPRLVCR